MSNNGSTPQTAGGLSKKAAEVESSTEVLLGRLTTYGATVRSLVAHHGISKREAELAIKRVRDNWGKEEPTEARRIRRSQLRAAAEDLFREARTDHDRATCLRCLDFLARLDGMDGSQMALHGRLDAAVDAEAEELRLRLEAWLASLSLDDRAEAVAALYAAEKAVHGATAAFLTTGGGGEESGTH